MELHFKNIFDSWPSGMLIASKDLRVIYANSHAMRQVLGIKGEDGSVLNLNDLNFRTPDSRRFKMEECMRDQFTAKQGTFNKTLVVKSGNHDKLVFFSVCDFRFNNEDLLLINIADISNEMDCIINSNPVIGQGGTFHGRKIIGNDPKVTEIFRMIGLAAETDVNVLVQGESGTGKELVADAVHELSYRGKGPFVKVNCSALSETLLESELFGHVKGAFTGAYQDKRGRFEQAHGGTIFLDEVGELSLSLQVKLLRVLQEKVIERVGDNKPVKVDMRIVAATNKDLRALIRQNLFRDDLFYRLNVFNITMPPLRDRHLDIPLLTEFFIDRNNSSYSRKIKGVSREALKILMEYNWPGNIRELQNAIEHAFVLARGTIIQVHDLPAEVRMPVNRQMAQLYPAESARLNQKGHEREIPGKNSAGRLVISSEQLLEVLQGHDWNQAKAADTLGISRVALWKKLKKLGFV